MIISILGTGCPNCVRLEKNTREAVELLKLEALIEKITDIEAIMSYGIMSTPALVVDNKIICSGRVPDVEEIKSMLTEQKEENNKPAVGGCSCGGKC